MVTLIPKEFMKTMIQNLCSRTSKYHKSKCKQPTQGVEQYIYSLSRSLSGSTNFIHYLLFLFYQENFWNRPQSYLHHMTLTISAEIKHLGYTPYYVTFHPVAAHNTQWNNRVIKQINNDRGLSEWLRGIGWGITWCHPINRSPAGLCSGVCSPAPSECFWVKLCVLPWKQINLGFRRQILKTVSIKQYKVKYLEHNVRASVWWYLPFGAVVAFLTIKSVLSQCLLRVSHSLLLSSEILTSYLP